MRKKIQINHSHFLHDALPAGYWTQVTAKKQTPLKRLCKHWQNKIDTLLATVAIGLMCLTGIWMFLVQLAEFGLH